MSSDLVGRRRAMEEHLDRVNALEQSLKNTTDVLADLAGTSIEQFDADGSLRATLSAVAGVASRRTQFDIIVMIPDSRFAVRIRLLHDSVITDVVAQREGTYEPVTEFAPIPAAELIPGPELARALTSTPELAEIAVSRSLELPEQAEVPDHPEQVAAELSGEVASELAALLWQSVKVTPS